MPIWELKRTMQRVFGQRLFNAMVHFEQGQFDAHGNLLVVRRARTRRWFRT